MGEKSKIDWYGPLTDSLAQPNRSVIGKTRFQRHLQTLVLVKYILTLKIMFGRWFSDNMLILMEIYWWVDVFYRFIHFTVMHFSGAVCNKASKYKKIQLSTAVVCNVAQRLTQVIWVISVIDLDYICFAGKHSTNFVSRYDPRFNSWIQLPPMQER